MRYQQLILGDHQPYTTSTGGIFALSEPKRAAKYTPPQDCKCDIQSDFLRVVRGLWGSITCGCLAIGARVWVGGVASRGTRHFQAEDPAPSGFCQLFEGYAVALQHFGMIVRDVRELREPGEKRTVAPEPWNFQVPTDVANFLQTICHSLQLSVFLMAVFLVLRPEMGKIIGKM